MRLKNLNLAVYFAAKERRLNCKYIGIFYDIKNDSPRSGLFILWNSESAQGELKLLIDVREDVREQTTLIIISFTAVAKHIVLLAMAMKI